MGIKKYLFFFAIAAMVQCSWAAEGVDEAANLASAVVTFDDLIKTGVELGELRQSLTPDAIGGEYFAKARQVIDHAWQFANVVKLQRDNPSLFNEIAAAYILYYLRNTTDYEGVRERFLSAVGNNFPDDAVLHYLFGLSFFRESESSNNPELMEKAFAHLDQALKLRKDFPEALWLRSQIYAAWRKPEKTKEDLAAIGRCADRFSPKLFLFDMSVIEIIKRAAGVTIR